MPKKKAKAILVIYMESGAVLRLPVLSYTVSYVQSTITKLEWEVPDDPQVVPKHINVNRIEAVTEEPL
jgi:hypothetical protein